MSESALSKLDRAKFEEEVQGEGKAQRRSRQKGQTEEIPILEINFDPDPTYREVKAAHPNLSDDLP